MPKVPEITRRQGYVLLPQQVGWYAQPFDFVTSDRTPLETKVVSEPGGGWGDGVLSGSFPDRVLAVQARFWTTPGELVRLECGERPRDTNGDELPWSVWVRDDDPVPALRALTNWEWT